MRNPGHVRSGQGGRGEPPPQRGPQGGQKQGRGARGRKHRQTGRGPPPARPDVPSVRVTLGPLGVISDPVKPGRPARNQNMGRKEGQQQARRGGASEEGERQPEP